VCAEHADLVARITTALAVLATFRHHDPVGTIADLHDALTGEP
jgi:hypothetical protein